SLTPKSSTRVFRDWSSIRPEYREPPGRHPFEFRATSLIRQAFENASVENFGVWLTSFRFGSLPLLANSTSNDRQIENT
ncbi:MAG: hypothetical protein O3A00_04560, partial [Planctomycetota bacterium]|nr:hypothetical protein [Planctomycetota bacterium]